MRRELWENRSIYLAPLTVAAVILFGFADRHVSIAGEDARASELDPANSDTIIQPYHLASR